ncbi:hypothetical protein [Microbulbifer sp. GL-2]|uniref:hypothetical protein n=1 Tax=Microbulbifer sp. GL-2 TaxID=2591606 RepID=UPI001162E5CB|nr:hypothetical protein [Microbulbifer sp. GL-2]BBM03252.1 hypothetical protein GL2_33260 [Microbulbifer sp. GL-2]
MNHTRRIGTTKFGLIIAALILYSGLSSAEDISWQEFSIPLDDRWSIIEKAHGPLVLKNNQSNGKLHIILRKSRDVDDNISLGLARTLEVHQAHKRPMKRETIGSFEGYLIPISTSVDCKYSWNLKSDPDLLLIVYYEIDCEKLDMESVEQLIRNIDYKKKSGDLSTPVAK